MLLSPGDKLGPYEILAPLGAGGMGEVYRAHDTRLNRDVALKILPAELAKDPSRRQRFELEARAVAALNHPNIVAVYDVGDGYIVSELVDGEPLGGGKLSVRKILEVATQIASGLAAAHDAGIVHRDLKPDNILLTRDGRPKTLDFGLAKVQPAHAGAADETVTVRTEVGVVMGTPGYMSPEQVRGVATDHRSDIFSFGAILHELLSGKRVFHGETSVDTMQAILRHRSAGTPRVRAGGRAPDCGALSGKGAGRPLPIGARSDVRLEIALRYRGFGTNACRTGSAPKMGRSRDGNSGCSADSGRSLLVGPTRGSRRSGGICHRRARRSESLGPVRGWQVAGLCVARQ